MTNPTFNILFNTAIHCILTINVTQFFMLFSQYNAKQKHYLINILKKKKKKCNWLPLTVILIYTSHNTFVAFYFNHMTLGKTWP